VSLPQRRVFLRVAADFRGLVQWNSDRLGDRGDRGGLGEGPYCLLDLPIPFLAVRDPWFKRQRLFGRVCGVCGQALPMQLPNKPRPFLEFRLFLRTDFFLECFERADRRYIYGP
jgi:hypothetical protein